MRDFKGPHKLIKTNKKDIEDINSNVITQSNQYYKHSKLLSITTDKVRI